MAYFLDSADVTYKERYEPEHVYIFLGKCITSGKDITVTVTAKDLFKYHQGELIQYAFPYLSSSQREWMMSGMHEFPFDED